MPTARPPCGVLALVLRQLPRASGMITARRAWSLRSTEEPGRSPPSRQRCARGRTGRHLAALGGAAPGRTGTRATTQRLATLPATATKHGPGQRAGPRSAHTLTHPHAHTLVYMLTHTHIHTHPRTQITLTCTHNYSHTRACSLTYTLTPTFTITLTLTCTHTHGPGCGCARGAEGCRPHGPRGLRRLLAGAGHSPRRLRSGPHPLARSRSAHSPLPTRPGPSVSHSPASPREEDERGRGGCTAAGTPRAARRALLPRKQLARCSGPRGAEVRGIVSPSISLQIYPEGNISQPGGVGDQGPIPRHRTPPRREGPGNEKLPELQQDCGRRQRGSAQARGPKLAGRRPQGRPRPRPGTCAHDTSCGRGTLQVRFSQGP